MLKMNLRHSNSEQNFSVDLVYTISLMKQNYLKLLTKAIFINP